MSLSKPWLKNYPPDVPAEVNVPQNASLVDMLEDAFRKYSQRTAAVCMDQAISFAEIDEMSIALGAWLQSKGLQRGDRIALMMPNVPQYMVAIAAVLRAGYAVVNVNPLYTPRELEHQLRDSGAQAIIILENFATTLQEVLEKTGIKHVVLASMGDMLGTVKGAVVNFVVRHLRKMVPEYELPAGQGRSVTRFNQAVAEGARMTLQRSTIAAGRCGLPPVHRRHDRGIERRHAAAPECRGQHHADRSVVQAHARQGGRQAAHRRVRAAAVPHLRAHDLLHDGRTAGHDQPAHPEPSRHSGIHQDLAEASRQHVPGGQYAVQCAGQRSGVREARLFGAGGEQWRRHGRAASDGRKVVADHGLPGRRGLWPFGDLAGRHQQSVGLE